MIRTSNVARAVCCFIALSLLLAARGDCGITGEIGDREFLEDVPYKVLVLEYDSPQRSAWGRELSQLIARQVLGSMRGLSHAGVVDLKQREQRVLLRPERVVALAREQEAQVVIWGEFYLSEKGVYLHSHLRLVTLRHLRLMARLPGSNLPVQAALPSLQINFSPIAVSLTTLNQLRDLAEQSVTIRLRPSQSAPAIGRLMLREIHSVQQTRQGWMLVETPERRGWVYYAALEPGTAPGSARELREVGAVVEFAQGALQYIGGSYAAAEETLRAYLSQYAAKQDSMNQAVARILLTNASILKRRDRSWSTAGDELLSGYLQAAQLLPNSASPVNHLAFALLQRSTEREGFSDQFRDLENRLIHVIKTEGDLDSILNLRSLYNLAARRRLLLRDSKQSLESYQASLARQIRLLDNLERNLSPRKVE